MPAEIIDFHQIRLARKAVESENTLAATWQETWNTFFDIWGSACLETLEMVHQTQLAYVAILEQIVFMERQKEAEESARLIREVVGEV
jgi:hypothetical protein